MCYVFVKNFLKNTLASLLFLSAMLTSCSRPENTLIVGTIAGPETSLMEVAQSVAKEKYNLTIVIKSFSDYVLPNIALNDGSIDANVFQHQPYLNAVLKNQGFNLVSIGKTFIYPMAAYSKAIKHINDLPKKAIIAIPNDPSNEARALFLLQKAQLITLNKVEEPSVLDITHNPKNLQIKTMSAAQLPRILDDVTLAVINTNYALLAGLSPKRDGLIMEDKDSPYANIIVVRAKDKDKPLYKKLVKALQDKRVLNKAKTLFQDEAIRAWP